MIYRRIIGDMLIEFEGTKDEILHIINSEAKGNINFIPFISIKPDITMAEKENIIENIEDEINRSLKNMGFK